MADPRLAGCSSLSKTGAIPQARSFPVIEREQKPPQERTKIRERLFATARHHSPAFYVMRASVT